MSFLLTSEPWIPSLIRGQCVELGLREVLARAHEIDGVNDASPLVTLSLHRLLLAILHRVFGPPDLDAWCDLYRRGAFDMKRLDAYFDTHRERFDLLHPERPFFQTRNLPPEYEADGLGRLVLERSNYGAPAFVFQHRPTTAEDNDQLSFGPAARALLALHAFAPGGLIKKPGEPGSASAAPLNRGAYVLVCGATLFETLAFNLLVYAPGSDAPIPGSREKDIPSWEQSALVRPTGEREPRRRPHGWVDLLTWQSRRVELVLTADRTAVRGIIYCVGQGLEPNGPTDPMLAVRVDDRRGPMAVEISEDRALWRDCHSLIRSASSDGARPPRAIEQLSRPAIRRTLGDRRELTLSVLGMRGDQAAIKLAREERVRLPLALLDEPDLVTEVEEALKLADAIATQLRWAVRLAVADTLAPSDREPDREDVDRITRALATERTYFGALGIPFEGFLDALGRADSEARIAFSRTARDTALTAFERSSRSLGSGARQLQGSARAELRLRASLNELVNSQGGAA